MNLCAETGTRAKEANLCQGRCAADALTGTGLQPAVTDFLRLSLLRHMKKHLAKKIVAACVLGPGKGKK